MPEYRGFASGTAGSRARCGPCASSSPWMHSLDKPSASPHRSVDEASRGRRALRSDRTPSARRATEGGHGPLPNDLAPAPWGLTVTLRRPLRGLRSRGRDDAAAARIRSNPSRQENWNRATSPHTQCRGAYAPSHLRPAPHFRARAPASRQRARSRKRTIMSDRVTAGHTWASCSMTHPRPLERPSLQPPDRPRCPVPTRVGMVDFRIEAARPEMSVSGQHQRRQHGRCRHAVTQEVVGGVPWFRKLIPIGQSHQASRLTGSQQASPNSIALHGDHRLSARPASRRPQTACQPIKSDLGALSPLPVEVRSGTSIDRANDASPGFLCALNLV